MAITNAYDTGRNPNATVYVRRLITHGVSMGGGAGGTPAPTVYYRNQVWDTIASGYITWISTGSYDVAGVSYPGPGVFGVQTSNYVGKGTFV